MKVLNIDYIKLFIFIFLIFFLIRLDETNHLKNEINNIKELLTNNLLSSNNSNIIQFFFNKQNSFCNNFYNYYNELFEKK